MEISERIKLIIKSHNLTASSFADRLGIQRSSVSHLLAGRNKPSLDVLQKILNHFPRVNATWLVTGETPNNSPDSSDSSTTSAVKTKEEVSTIDKVKDEDPPEYSKQISLNKPENKKLVSIVKFFSDGTFSTYYPEK